MLSLWIIKHFWDRRVFGQAEKSMGGDQYINDKFEGDLHFCKKCKKGKRSGEDLPLWYVKAHCVQFFSCIIADIAQRRNYFRFWVTPLCCGKSRRQKRREWNLHSAIFKWKFQGHHDSRKLQFKYNACGLCYVGILINLRRRNLKFELIFTFRTN